MTISDYYSELMKQSFNDSVGINYTPYAIMLYLKENKYFIKNETLDSLCRFIYRFYADNPEYSKKNSSVLISNISHYYPSDLKEYVIEQLKTWMKNGNEVLLTDGTFLTINPAMCLLSDKEIQMLNKIVDSLSVRNFRKIISYSTLIEKEILNINYDRLSFDEYCEIVNKTKFKKRAFEDINYCACCEETNLNNLQAIHLNFAKSLADPENSIVLCKNHARLYYEGCFRFSKTGRIIIYKNCFDLDKRMHLNKKLTISKNKYMEEQ